MTGGFLCITRLRTQMRDATRDKGGSSSSAIQALLTVNATPMSPDTVHILIAYCPLTTDQIVLLLDGGSILDHEPKMLRSKFVFWGKIG